MNRARLLVSPPGYLASPPAAHRLHSAVGRRQHTLLLSDAAGHASPPPSAAPLAAAAAADELRLLPPLPAAELARTG